MKIEREVRYRLIPGEALVTATVYLIDGSYFCTTCTGSAFNGCVHSDAIRAQFPNDGAAT